MHVVRLAAAPRYDAPLHEGMAMFRLQGREAGPSDLMWLGLSQILPGGGISSSASSEEKFYVVLDGELIFETPGERHVLRRWDSCRIDPHEPRAIRNEGTFPAVVLLAMPLPGADRK